VALDNEVGRSALAEMLAHRQASLAAADDERFNFFICHGGALFGRPIISTRRTERLLHG
jgi:hypothetical protein